VIGESDPRHGTERGYSAGCRQFCCKRAHAEYNAQRKVTRKEKGIPDHVHGSRNGYVNFDCRCDACKIASIKA
jgi:hypothetical protein